MRIMRLDPPGRRAPGVARASASGSATMVRRVSHWVWGPWIVCSSSAVRITRRKPVWQRIGVDVLEWDSLGVWPAKVGAWARTGLVRLSRPAL